MGNRIADIGKMKSIVDGENRLRARRLTKRAKLGTEKNPAVVHVRTEQRLKEIASLLKEKGWKYQITLEPDKPEDITDLVSDEPGEDSWMFKFLRLCQHLLTNQASIYALVHSR